MSNKKILLNEKSNPPAMRGGENGISGDGENNKIKSPVI